MRLSVWRFKGSKTETSKRDSVFLSYVLDHMEERGNMMIIISPSVRSIGWNLEGQKKMIITF